MAKTESKDPRRKRSRRRFVIGLLLLVVVFLLGPRVSIRDVRAGGPIELPVELSRLDQFLEDSEKPFNDDLIQETEKKVFWHDEKTRTPVSIVFLHGFSGSHMTLAPMQQEVAMKLNANLYCNRYTGHGRKNSSGFGEAMAEATLQNWVDDTREALAIGRKLGDTVVVIANSTAAPLATWLSSHGDAPDALVLLSPNFGPRNPMSEVLLWPWGRQILYFNHGDSYRYAPENIYGPDHRKFATTWYPSSALLTMMAAVELGRSADPAAVTIPVLFLYSKLDQVISPDAAKKVFGRFPNPSNRMVEIMSGTHKEHHILAGDIMSKGSTGEVVDAIADFLTTEVIGVK